MFLDVLQYFSGVFVVVYDGQHAVKFTLGRVSRVVGPGVHFKWPVIQKFRKEETKDTTLDLETQVIHLADDLVFEVSAKVVYQIVDLEKAMVEVDDLQMGLRNRLTLSVQRVIQAQTRDTIGDVPTLVKQIGADLREVERKWGFEIRTLGFSQFSPTPATLEITQLRLLTEEKLQLFQRFRQEERMSEEAAVSLVSGAVVALQREDEREQQPDDVAPVPAPTARDLIEDETDDRKDEDDA